MGSAGLTAPEVEDQIINIEELFPYETDDGNAQRRAHIIRASDNDHISMGDEMDASEIVDTARLTAQEVVALCGHKWVPTRNPKEYPLCETCEAILGVIHAGGEN